MRNLVEVTERNEVLDAIWYSKVFGKDIDNLSFADMLGIAGRLKSIGQLVFGKYRLILIWDKTVSGLHNNFSSDEEIKHYITTDIDSAFTTAIDLFEPYIYILNIASVENYGALSLKRDKDLLKHQLSIYLPVIEQFMLKAFTDNISNKEQE